MALVGALLQVGAVPNRYYASADVERERIQEVSLSPLVGSLPFREAEDPGGPHFFFGGSWVVIRGCKSIGELDLEPIRGPITPRTTTHEPPSLPSVKETFRVRV